MRALLLAGAAGAALAVAAPFAGGLLEPRAGRVDTLSGAFDPLRLAGSMCGPRSSGWTSRAAAFLSAARAYADETAPAAADAAAPPLWSGLGHSTLPITTSVPQAQAYFDQGLRHMDNFNHAEAVRAFRYAQTLDPACALCFWGEALALGPNINASMSEGDYPRAFEAAAKAAELADAHGTEKERALAHALAARYAKKAPRSRGKLDAAWADAMSAAADRWPDDDELQALAAEAVMDLQPWDYWEADTVTPKGRAGEAIARVETVLARNPDHAPSIHMYIHLTEASGDPWRAERYADRLGALAPQAGHLVHMPSHTYYEIGRFKDSLAVNLEAVAADEALLAATKGGGQLYRYGYYPHNLHMALVSAQMAGDRKAALELADKLDAALPLEWAAVAPWVQPVKAAPWYARAQLASADEVLAYPAPPADALPFLVAAWRYARGEALARAGRPQEALDEAAAIGVLRESADPKLLAIGGAQDLQVLDIMVLLIQGRAADARGDLPAAIDAYRKAADIQAGLPYGEPPYWWYPVRQTLASALLRSGQAKRAEVELYRTLIESPSNGWAYWGLAEARKALGDKSGARDARRKFRDAWAGGDDEPTLERL